MVVSVTPGNDKYLTNEKLRAPLQKGARWFTFEHVAESILVDVELLRMQTRIGSSPESSCPTISSIS